MLNTRAATDARHSRAGKDAMIYDEKGNALAQAESFTTNASFNNNNYTPLGQNRELEVNNTVGVKVNITEIVVLDGFLFNKLMARFMNKNSKLNQQHLLRTLYVDLERTRVLLLRPTF